MAFTILREEIILVNFALKRISSVCICTIDLVQISQCVCVHSCSCTPLIVLHVYRRVV